MILKRWCLVASVFIVTTLVITASIVSAEPGRSFREKNGLQAHVPPEWFLKGYFIACEKNPAYVFGPVQDFVGALGGTTTWLIEDMEFQRLKSGICRRKRKSNIRCFLKRFYLIDTEVLGFRGAAV